MCANERLPRRSSTPRQNRRYSSASSASASRRTISRCAFSPKVFADEHQYVPVDILPGSGHALIRPIKLITTAHNYILGDRMEVGERQSTWSVLPYQ